MISFDAEKRLFLLTARASSYAMLIDREDRVVHLAHVPCAAPPVTLDFIELYEPAVYHFIDQSIPYELLARGDVNQHATALQASFNFLGKPLADGEAPNLPVRDLRLRYCNHVIDGDSLALHLKDAVYDLFVTLHYRLSHDHDVIERSLTIENRTGGSVLFDSIAFASVHLPKGGKKTLLTSAGGWAREFVLQRVPLTQGTLTLDQRGLTTGHAVNPAYIIADAQETTEASGPAWFGALAYSGNWALRFETLSTGASIIIGGYEPSDCQVILEPGQSHTTPAFVCGVSLDGIGGASRRLHDYARDRILPRRSAPRPVLYNSWEATYFNLSHDNQLALAKKAAAIGVELFCVDDGWFGARRNDRAGLGDWVVSRDVFPQGLRPLADEIRALGMQFGLWFEPEMVNPDSDLYRAHPDWVLHFPGRPRSPSRAQLILDLGRPEVLAYLRERLLALVGEIGIDFIKWDMNRYVTEPGSVAGVSIFRKHVEGVYALMDELRQRYPQLMIQSCSGGGGRVDLGMLRRADQVWTSDNTDACDRTLIEDGFSHFYPPAVMESWVTHEHNHQTGRHSTLDVRFDVAMRGVLGIGSSLDILDEAELERYRRKIAFYKRLRPILHDGSLYRLSTADCGGASVWQTNAKDRSSAVYSFVNIDQRQGEHRPFYRLRDLLPRASYAIIDDSLQTLQTFSGAQLMSIGIPGDSRYGGLNCAIRSRTLLLEAQPT